jgi:hypothetical protein
MGQRGFAGGRHYLYALEDRKAREEAHPADPPRKAPLLSLCAHGNARFRLQTPGQRPGGPKAISYQYQSPVAH